MSSKQTGVTVNGFFNPEHELRLKVCERRNGCCWCGGLQEIAKGVRGLKCLQRKCANCNNRVCS